MSSEKNCSWVAKVLYQIQIYQWMYCWMNALLMVIQHNDSGKQQQKRPLSWIVIFCIDCMSHRLCVHYDGAQILLIIRVDLFFFFCSLNHSLSLQFVFGSSLLVMLLLLIVLFILWFSCRNFINTHLEWAKDIISCVHFCVTYITAKLIVH